MSIECLSAGILFADCGCEPIERLPKPGELVKTERIGLTLGGCASNAGLDLAKLGFSVGVSGCVGADGFGEFIVETLEGGGVDTKGIHALQGRGTACSLILNVEGKDRGFISSPGACLDFSVAHIPDDWIDEAKVIYIGGYLMMPALETPELSELFRKARAAGTKTVLDVVLMGSEDYWKGLDLVLSETDVFLPNDDESVILTGLDDPLEQARRYRDSGANAVVITQGDKGSIYMDDNICLRAGVYPTTFVGGTGSGDAFDAGYIAGMLAGEDPTGCLRWGSALGASCVRSIGATESVFNRAEAEAFMAEHELVIEEI
ncbi:MAG: sugar kinase [Pirellulales bacterium]|nr:sugar kinase [Pirellulales bacterium]